MRKLRIDETLFFMAFNRDVDVHDAHPQSTYLDKETGDILWVYETDDGAHLNGIEPAANRRSQITIATTPHRYLTIPGLSHGDHHQILKEFLDSDWTPDEQHRQHARDAYIVVSIGHWRRSVDDSATTAYDVYREQTLRERAVRFLKSHGIEPVWQ